MAPNNVLPIHGNEKTMNLNSLILTNIQASPYFKNSLYDLKTYHEVLDEIYYKVNHLEPWEKGSRKTAGQTGMCGGVRGVGAGGIVSSAFCLVYKLYTMRLTRKQLNGLINHTDSPYIRGVGFMYIRYTQPPADFWDWYSPYLDDEEELDVKAGGGCVMTIGAMVRSMMVKLEWWSTLFPRIPVPIQKKIDVHLKALAAEKLANNPQQQVESYPDAQGAEIPQEEEPRHRERDERSDRLRDDRDRRRSRSRSRSRDDRHRSDRTRDRRDDRDSRSSRHHRDNDPDRRDKDRARDRDREYRRSHDDERRDRRDRDKHSSSSSRKHKHHKRSRSKDRRDRSRSKERHEKPRSKDYRDRSRSRSKDRRERSRSHDRFESTVKLSKSKDGSKKRESSFERDLRKERERQHYK